MSLKEKLHSFTKIEGHNKTDSNLYKLACDIEEFASAHLKRIFQVLTEFDLHDASHSQQVIKNIELILGEDIINNLNSYEIFFLFVSSYLHDCAMAPAEWELRLMTLTEGTNEYYDSADSIKNDLKASYKYTDATSFVSKIWSNLRVDIEWLFCPDSEDDLKKELATILIEYQNHRNGFRYDIESINNREDFIRLNKALRMDFIRLNHHVRIERYIKNLSTHFGKVMNQPAWGKKLSNDLALICRSHGENIAFLSKIENETHYIDASLVNLQFVSMMLRLGDIIHYSYDRAPASFYKGKVFESDYSFHEWAVKNNGVNYDIQNGRINFKAYCSNPNDYFKLHKYIDFIDQEIQNYFILSRGWNSKYKVYLEEKVNRAGINNDEDVFLPVRGLSFKLNQKQILELLMGVGLYKDKYACLRELYQNALDACRTLKSSMVFSGIEKKFKIEFGIEVINGKKYLYCHDNGIGMDRNIIESYLLNIGNSYYKSPRFYREQANCSGDFMPTSQFGIGILSCFMLGNRIDISTKKNGSDLISCSIEGPHENFYYRSPDILDNELISESGTLIRVLLSDEIGQEVDNFAVENHYLYDILNSQSYALERSPEKFNEYISYPSKWKGHILFKLNSYITSIFDDIPVLVKLDNLTCVEVVNKPYFIDYRMLGLSSHRELLDFLYEGYNKTDKSLSYSERIDSVSNYIISSDYEGSIFSCQISFPLKDSLITDSAELFKVPASCNNTMSVDGIRTDERNSIPFDGTISKLSRIGNLNFTGKIRPQLSVDRNSIISIPSELENHANELLLKTIDASLNKLIEHIKLESININSKEFNICLDYIFSMFSKFNRKLLPIFLSSELGNSNWSGLYPLINRDLSIRDFIGSKEIYISHPNKVKMNLVTKSIIHSKLAAADNIIVNIDKVCIVSNELEDGKAELLIYDSNEGLEHYKTLFLSDSWNVINSDYDIVTSALPIIPRKLFDIISHDVLGLVGKRINISHYSNGIGAFFEQDPLLVHPKLGLFVHERDAFNSNKKRSQVYNFEKKRSNFYLSEMNDFSERNKRNFICLYVYISPATLSEADEAKLKEHMDDHEYVNGVRDGWSVLVTGMNEFNTLIKPGVHNRDALVKLLPERFWIEFSEYKFRFCDGTIMEKPYSKA